MGMRSLWLALGLCVAAAPAVAIDAFQITEANVDGLQRGGPDAIAGIGDWWLSDGELCVAISDIEHDSGIVAGGGSLIDVGHCDLQNDQWTYSNVLTGLAKENAIAPQHISATQAGRRAEIRVVGEADGIRQTLVFALDKDRPGELQQQIIIERVGDGRAVHLSGLLTLYPHRAMTPFTLSSYAPDYSLGFNHPLIDREDMFSLVAGMMPADWVLLLGEHRYPSTISYGFQLQRAELVDLEGQRHRLPQFLITLPDYALHGWLTRPLWIDSEKPGLLQMLQSQFMDLEVGERMEVTLRLLPEARADAAAITDGLYTGSRLYGFVDADAASVMVTDMNGRPLTQRRLQAPGEFSLHLPESVGTVRVSVTAPWGEQLERELDIAGNTDTGRWRFAGRGTLRLPRDESMMLHVYGVDGTPTPDLHADMVDFRVDGEPVHGSLSSHRLALAGIPSDRRSLSLPPGRYRVLASRGPEFGVSEALVDVRAGETSVLEIAAPKRQFDIEGWLSADLHVHSGASFDSSLPVAERLRSFAAEGTNLLVSTEHNRVMDHRKTLESLGLADRIQLVSGVEITGMARTAKVPRSIGHSNVYPYPVDERAFAGGVPKVEDRYLRELIGSVRQRAPQALVQLNHPRASGLDDDEAFFDHLSIDRRFDAQQALTSRNNRSLLEADPNTGLRDLDFDVLEVLNGTEYEGYRRTLQDWFALLRQGERFTAAGNSDSHELSRIVGMPRNYIAVNDGIAWHEALRKGRSYLTSGPLLDVSVAGGAAQAGPGETVTAKELLVGVNILASDWVMVDTLRIYLNGEMVHEQAVSANQRYSVPVHADSDSFVVVEVLGKAGDIYQAVYPGMQPLALSNPVYIDADGDGRWQSPGL